MSTLSARKGIRTYSRHKKHSLHNEEPPTKRRRVETTTRTIETEESLRIALSSIARNSSPTYNGSIPRPSSPEESPAIFSDEPPRSTPPSSPAPPSSSPPLGSRRPVFSFLKRKTGSIALTKELLSERSNNAQITTKPAPRRKRLVQMQLDLVGEVRKACKVCGMEYIPSNAEDAALHRKFHAMNIGGVDFTKAFVERLKQNQVWEGNDGSFIATVGRRDTLALRNKATDVLKVVTAQLAAVPIPEEDLWGQIRIPISANAQVQGSRAQNTAIGKSTSSTSDRFKAYLYIQGQKCVGACLAERIQEAYTVVDRDDASEHTGHFPAESESSSISISETTEPALLGISRIWTSSSYRKHGIAMRMLDSARSDFLYGMTIEKARIAFSQPTESGGRLARKWFGQQTGWHVYID